MKFLTSFLEKAANPDSSKSQIPTLRELTKPTEPTAVQKPDLADGTVKAVRGQRTEFRNLAIDANTTGVLICSSVLGSDIWLALRDDFEPDPDLPFAVFYLHDIAALKDKTVAQLKKIHETKLAFGPARVRQ